MTAANSSSISDGAAALVLMRASARPSGAGSKPLAAIVAPRDARAAEPSMVPHRADRRDRRSCFARPAGRASDVDLFEINEAFAVVAMAAMRDLGLPHDKVNVHGGACALGHPIGASGARIIVTLLAALAKHAAASAASPRCASAAARRRRSAIERAR